MNIKRISRLEHELELTMPCSDPQCQRCALAAIDPLIRSVYEKIVASKTADQLLYALREGGSPE